MATPFANNLRGPSIKVKQTPGKGEYTFPPFGERMKQARQKIEWAERDLHRRLSDGERRDLLKDNFEWPSDECDNIVRRLHRKKKG